METYGKQPLPTKNIFRQTIDGLAETFRDAPKTVLITGGASGIGLGIAHETKKKCKDRANLILMGRNVEKGEKVMEDFTVRDRFIRGDVLKSEDFIKLLDEKIDVIVSNAGLPADGKESNKQRLKTTFGEMQSVAMDHIAPIDDYFSIHCQFGDFFQRVSRQEIADLVEHWKTLFIDCEPILGTKFLGLINCYILAMLQRMLYGHKPRVILISSSTALKGHPSVLQYSDTHKMLDAFAFRLNNSRKISISTVCPRSIDTDFLVASLSEEDEKKYRERFPPMDPVLLGEIIQDEFIAPSNAYFAAHRAGREFLVGIREGAQPETRTGEYRGDDIVFEGQWSEIDKNSPRGFPFV